MYDALVCLVSIYSSETTEQSRNLPLEIALLEGMSLPRSISTHQKCRFLSTAVQPASHVSIPSVRREESQQFHLGSSEGFSLARLTAQHEVSVYVFRLESVLATCCPLASRWLSRFSSLYVAWIGQPRRVLEDRGLAIIKQDTADP